MLECYEVLGGPATFTVMWTSERFTKANPKVVPILVAALKQADDFIKDDPAGAASIYMADTHTKLTQAQLVKMIKNPEVSWTTTPRKTMKYARFIHEIGMIQNPPKDCKEMFFPEIGGQSGS